MICIDKINLTVLSFSAGTQSSCLLWMVLDGAIPKPDNFLVVMADPGMENSRTYEYSRMMAQRCNEAGIDFVIAKGPNLHRDATEPGDATRIDNPPLWIKRASGKRGQLRQKCTKEYKILPIQRAIRQHLDDRWGISANPKSTRHLLAAVLITQWIGFTSDESHRVEGMRKQKIAKHVRLVCPLDEMGMDSHGVVTYMREHGHELPPRSLCNGCFAHGLRSLRAMHDERPADWNQAVTFDDSIRDMGRYGVQDGECYVSDTLVPLRELAKRDFDLGSTRQNVKHECNTGMCFV